MVVPDAIHNIMEGIENTGDVRLHNHRRKLKQRFDIVKKLGQGTYGKVQLGINKETGQEVAIKTIRKCKIETEADLIRIRREIQIMSSVRHPNIIHIYEVFENREKMVLVMEYAAGGELYDYLSERKVLTEEEARRIFRQIATAVYYCHKHNICHRDLKLENILLDDVGNAKIADFGLSNVFSYKALLSTFCGSPLYASPEIVKGTPYHGPEVDCWSLGVLLYTLVYGAMPFDGSNFKRLVKQISHGDYFEPKNPSSASQLISEMLNVNPAKRADISAICNHWWINDTYSETCLDVAEELASQKPVRLDLLLSLTAPAVNSEKIVVGADQILGKDDINGVSDRPVRSHSLGSMPPSTIAPAVVPFPIPEMKESEGAEDKKPKVKKKERSRSKTKRKDRSRSRSRKSENRETSDTEKGVKVNEENNTDSVQTTPNSLVNSDTQIITKPAAEPVKPVEKVENEKEPSTKEDIEAKPKPVERRKSKVFEVAEKFNANNEKPMKSSSSKKIVLPGINVDGARKEYERRSSLASGSTTPPKKTTSASPPIASDETFPLASTVALNKLVESAFRDDGPPFENTKPAEDKSKITTKVTSDSTVEANINKAATLPRRKTSKAEIHLITPQFPPDNYKTEVEHFIKKPTVNHRSEIVIPVSAPLPPKSLVKANNQSKEHVIPIQCEEEPTRRVTSPSSSRTASKSSIARTSSSSLSRQSTVESDSDSTISRGEPIRKSPREVIIPIAVEGGGFVTPSHATLSRMSSMNDSEDKSKNNSRCFTLRSTKRRQPEPSQSAQLDNADSLSSDEDDNLQLLTAENLFSTLLSRVRSLTQRLNNDEMRRTSAFPRSLFTQNSSLFDNIPSRRITETRSFSRPESAPWRRVTISNNPLPRDDSTKKRYSYIRDGKPSTIHEIAETKPPQNNAADAGGREPKSPNSSIESEMEETKPKPKPHKKSNIEEEFDNFFAKYRKPIVNARSLTHVAKPFADTKPKLIPDAIAAVKADVNDEDHVKKKPPRKSRFLRPDFYDTPREESKYVIKNETVRAFRERSLSRQRELSRNRSTDSFSNGLGTDYIRSKTCSLADRMDARKRDYKRTTSADGANDSARSRSRNEDVQLDNFDRAKRKSLTLQNELENEMRKTKTMNSKLSGLMMALSDAENQYEKKMGRLYGPKAEKVVANENADVLRGVNGTTPSAVNGESEGDQQSATCIGTDMANHDKLSLLEKKFAYFRRLQKNDRHDREATTGEKQDEATESNECEERPAVLDIPAPGSNLENGTSSLTTPTEDVDSDAWSVISDGADSQYQDDVNNRIRRRSFYSRFNTYKQRSPTNSSATRSKPTIYSRSLSADYRSRSTSTSRPA